MENNMITKGKIAMFLLLCVTLIFVYVVTLPTQSIHYKSYTFHLFGIIYTIVMLCSIMIIDTKKIAKKDYIVAVSLGLMSVGITSPINYMGLLSGICTVFAYLASITLSDKNTNKMVLIRSIGMKYIIKSVAVILSMGCFFALLQWIFGQGSIIFSFEISSLFRALGAGISEEIVFRLFIFSIILHICKGEEIPKLLTFSAMVIPFSMLHVIDQAVNSGLINSLPNIIQVVLIATPITILAWKRDLLSAMGVHFMYDLVSMSFLIK